MRNPQPSDAQLAAIYTDTYFLGTAPTGKAAADAFEKEVNALKRATAAGYLDRVEAYRGWTPETRKGKKLLEIGSGLGNMLIEARERGYNVTGVEYASASVARANARLGQDLVVQGTVDSAPLREGTFDVCVFADRDRAHPRSAGGGDARVAAAGPGGRAVRGHPVARQLVGPAHEAELDGVQGRAPVLLRQPDARIAAGARRFRTRCGSIEGARRSAPAT